MEAVGVISRSAQDAAHTLPNGQSVPQSADPAELIRRTQADVAVDFTHGDWTPVLARASLAAGCRLVTGTSGLSPQFRSDLERDCRERSLGAVIAPNFAIGAVLMIHLSALAARFFEQAEIIEMHHEQKADAPSGTAIATAEAMARAHGGPFQRNKPSRETLAGARAAALAGVTIHSVRLPGLIAHQEVIFGADGQTLTIRHDSFNRESFMPGVLAAIRWVMGSRELVIGLERVLGLQ